MIIEYKTAFDLPENWDFAAGNNFSLHKRNLLFLEAVNPCSQVYAVIKRDKNNENDDENNGTMSVLIYYKLKLNVLCYGNLKLDLHANVIGIPCSVSEPGFSVKDAHLRDFYEYAKSLKGLTLILNVPGELSIPDFSWGHTLPTCMLDVKWASFDDYLAGIRSHYRYRFRKAIQKVEDLTIRPLQGEFSNSHYRLYERVYDRSGYKLEKLGIEYFQHSAEAGARTVEFLKDEEPVAFVQYMIRDDKMVFLFGGLNYQLNKPYDLYQNMLLYLVRTAIENNCTSLNLGQTAEEMKCRLGAHIEERYLYVHHSNGLINKIIKSLIPSFCYKVGVHDYHVLKPETTNPETLCNEVML